MWPNKQHSLGWVFVSRMIGILCFLIVVVLANILTYYVQSPLYHSGVAFLDLNFWLLLLIAIIIFVADIFGAFPFPLNLPAPVIKAIGSVFIIAFVLRVFEWVDTATGNNIYHYFWLLSFVIVPIVFIIVLLAGYYEIVCDLWAKAKLREESEGAVGEKSAVQEPPAPKSWEDVGAEFRLMMYELIHRFREELRHR
jgi:Membrane-bound serine protease (ClpP class)